MYQEGQFLRTNKIDNTYKKTGSTARISKWRGPMKWKKYRPPWLGDKENFSD